MMTKFKVALPPETEARLIEEARANGLHPCALARVILCKHFGGGVPSNDAKTYTFTTRNWRELEAYCWVRNYISVEAGIPILLDHGMSRDKPSAKQKALMESFIEKTEGGASACVRWGL